MTSELSLFSRHSLIEQGYSFVNTTSENPVEEITNRLFNRVKEEGGLGAWIARCCSCLSRTWIRYCSRKALSAWKFVHVTDLSKQSLQPHLETASEQNAKELLRTGKHYVLSLAKEKGLPQSQIEDITSIFESCNKSKGLQACLAFSNFIVVRLIKAVGSLLSCAYPGKVDTQSTVYDEEERAIFKFDPNGDLLGDILNQQSDSNLTLGEMADRWDSTVKDYASDPSTMVVDQLAQAGFHDSRIKKRFAKKEIRETLLDPDLITKISQETLGQTASVTASQ